MLFLPHLHPQKVLVIAATAQSSLLPFLMFFFLGGSLLFATTAHANLAVMLAAPRHLRPLSLAINSVSMHALGDVPSPTLIGALKDALAPHCAVTSLTDEGVWKSAGVAAFVGRGADMVYGEDFGEGSWLGISEACRCGSWSLYSTESCTVRFIQQCFRQFFCKLRKCRCPPPPGFYREVDGLVQNFVVNMYLVSSPVTFTVMHCPYCHTLPLLSTYDSSI